MGVWVGVYLASTDLRLCNAYSLESQIQTGRGMVGLSLLAGAVWLASPRGSGRARNAAAQAMQG